MLKSRHLRDGAADGQVVGDAGHEMLSFKEIYLFVGEPCLLSPSCARSRTLSSVLQCSVSCVC